MCDQRTVFSADANKLVASSCSAKKAAIENLRKQLATIDKDAMAKLMQLDNSSNRIAVKLTQITFTVCTIC